MVLVRAGWEGVGVDLSKNIICVYEILKGFLKFFKVLVSRAHRRLGYLGF